ncbi:MAG: DUF899 domain-containing protein, partial [Actinobacteria bacterium]
MRLTRPLTPTRRSKRHDDDERDTTFVLVSAAPIDAIERYKSRMGWDIPWFTTADDFSVDFGVD